MIIEFKTKKLKNQCENHLIANKDFGVNIGKKLIQRINELQAATSLLDIKSIHSARLHKLKGNRKNEFALDLFAQYRLIFSIQDNINLDEEKLENITIIRIEEVVDYHGE
jgi:proteic killer suppression protein